MTESAQEIVVKQIIEWLEQWLIPRNQTRITRGQKNLISNKAYEWFNQLLLSFISWSKWLSNYRMTRKQMNKKGWKLKEDAQASRICFYTTFKTGKQIEVKGEKIDEEKMALRYYIVYNLSHIEWIEIPEEEKEAEISYDGKKTLEDIEKYMEKQTIWKMFGTPCYNIARDAIQMPDRKDFDNEEHRLQTYFHEVIHSTWTDNRLKRDIENRMGDELYSKEELVAEIGSAILSNEYGIYFDQFNIQAYINWRCKYLKEKPREIINAGNKAFKAVNFYLDNIKD